MSAFVTGCRRATLFAGHYGSGKSAVAVNFALARRAAFPGRKLAVADLDIVNPYFRTKDSAALLAAHGIHLIASDFANTNVDLPALPGEAYSLTEDRELLCVIDVGGDDRGALALGRYTPALLAEGEFDMLAVINRYRPLTATPEDTLEVLREIERAGGLPFTGIVNNSNLGAGTTAADVEDSFDYAGRVSRLTGLPVRFTAVRAAIADEVREKHTGEIFAMHSFTSVAGLPAADC